MVIHQCPKCMRKFDRKSSFDDHLNKKKPCNEKNHQNKCEYCNKMYSRKYTLDRHIATIHKDIPNQTK